MTFDPALLKYDANGLIPCIAQDHGSGEVLMFAWMNAESVARTLATGAVTYWSRSRAAFWVKGESSGPWAKAGRVAHRLRPRLPAGACQPGRPGLPHQPAQLFLHGRARRGRSGRFSPRRGEREFASIPGPRIPRRNSRQPDQREYPAGLVPSARYFAGAGIVALGQPLALIVADRAGGGGRPESAGPAAVAGSAKSG